MIAEASETKLSQTSRSRAINSDQSQLSTKIKEIESLAKSHDQHKRSQALKFAEQLAISADLQSVQALFSLTPKLIVSIPTTELKASLRLWSSMYDGSHNVAAYPDFSCFTVDLPSSTNLNPTDQRLTKFFSNLKQKNNEVLFFDDSFVTETDDIESEKVAYQRAMFDIAEIEEIRDRIIVTEPALQKLEEYKNKFVVFQRRYDGGDYIKLMNSSANGVRVGQRLHQALGWCKDYINCHQRLTNKQLSYEQFQQQLKANQYTPGRRERLDYMLESDRGQFQYPRPLVESVMNSRGSTGGKGIGLTVNKNSTTRKTFDATARNQNSQETASHNNVTFKLSESPFQKLPFNSPVNPKPRSAFGPPKPIQTIPEVITLEQERLQVLDITPVKLQPRVSNRLNLRHEQNQSPQVLPSHIISLNKLSPPPKYLTERELQQANHSGQIDMSTPVELVITKHKPNNGQDSIIGSLGRSSPNREKARIFERTSSPGPSPGTDLMSATLSEGLKLSDFVYQKQKRKQMADTGKFHQTPDWIVSPFKEHFDSEDLFSRFRKSCLHKRSIIFKNSEIEVMWRLQRQSCRLIHIQIIFVNLTSDRLQIKIAYNISKSLKVVNPINVKSRFQLQQQCVHSFGLQILQLPLHPCLFQLTINSKQIPSIPLPITINRFVSLQYIDRQQFFIRWNRQNYQSYYTSNKMFYSRKVIKVSQMTFLFPEMAELGRKQNYSYDEFGCLAKYQHYSLEWLMVFAFNVDSLLTVEVLCCEEVTKEQVQFIEYYLNNLMMLIQKVYM